MTLPIHKKEKIRIKKESRPLKADSRRRTPISKKNKPTDIFVYGTLLNDNNVSMLLKRIPTATPAQLYNFMKLSPQWSFPFIVKHHGSATDGRILHNITKDELHILDEFENEGVLYKRQTVMVKDGKRKRHCETYIGNIFAIEKSFGKHIKFEDRYELYLEKKADKLLSYLYSQNSDYKEKTYQELAGSAIDDVIQSQFDGNYICNYVAVQALKNISPPNFSGIASNKQILPYADNYTKLLVKHVIVNQFVDTCKMDFPDKSHLPQYYFRYGLAILASLIYYNKTKDRIEEIIRKTGLDKFEKGKKYLDYLDSAINAAETVYNKDEFSAVMEEIGQNWYSASIPLGVELEFSPIGADIVGASPGQDPVFDGFYWFKDFDLYRRTWRFGAHIDAHRQITPGQEKYRGFLEYAFGRYQIARDLSRPVFDCPWGLSRLINESAKFSEILPHSLHLSFELKENNGGAVNNQNHVSDDLVCLLLLGGDISEDKIGKLREKRIFNGELFTGRNGRINFSEQKYHFQKMDDNTPPAEVMEYKFMRLHKLDKNREDFDYESLIFAIKAYQLASKGRPINPNQNPSRIREEDVLSQWAQAPFSLSKTSIDSFVAKIENGINLEQTEFCRLPQNKINQILSSIEKKLRSANETIKKYEKR
jgi:gamma-glutamylcyclotransferase (GGCT)/AIG2-like uncharacterized protein YtfP